MFYFNCSCFLLLLYMYYCFILHWASKNVSDDCLHEHVVSLPSSASFLCLLVWSSFHNHKYWIQTIFCVLAVVNEARFIHWGGRLVQLVKAPDCWVVGPWLGPAGGQAQFSFPTVFPNVIHIHFIMFMLIAWYDLYTVLPVVKHYLISFSCYIHEFETIFLQNTRLRAIVNIL